MVSQELQERRAYLFAYADRYFELLPSGGHQQLPIAREVVFTENGQRLRLGQGLWATATGVARTRAVTLMDGPAGQLATWGMVTEAGHDAILGVRLKVDDTERGLVLVCCFFDHPGKVRGLIRRIEAIGAAFPYGMRAGW